MKVLLVNGSPHKRGCTYTALCEVEGALNEVGKNAGILLPEQEQQRISRNYIR